MNNLVCNMYVCAHVHIHIDTQKEEMCIQENGTFVFNTCCVYTHRRSIKGGGFLFFLYLFSRMHIYLNLHAYLSRSKHRLR